MAWLEILKIKDAGTGKRMRVADVEGFKRRLRLAVTPFLLSKYGEAGRKSYLVIKENEYGNSLHLKISLRSNLWEGERVQWLLILTEEDGDYYYHKMEGPQLLLTDNDVLNNDTEIISALVLAITKKQHIALPKIIKVPEERRTGADVKRELEEANPGYIFNRELGRMEKKPFKDIRPTMSEVLGIQEAEARSQEPVSSKGPKGRKRRKGRKTKPFMPPRPEPPKKKPKRGRPKGAKNKPKKESRWKDQLRISPFEMGVAREYAPEEFSQERGVLKDVAKELGVSYQSLLQYSKKPDFPNPVAKWNKKRIIEWLEEKGLGTRHKKKRR